MFVNMPPNMLRHWFGTRNGQRSTKLHENGFDGILPTSLRKFVVCVWCCSKCLSTQHSRYEALGRAAYAQGDVKTAMRAYTSIAEVAPTNAAYLKRAGWLLASLVVRSEVDDARSCMPRRTSEQPLPERNMRAAALSLQMFRRAYVFRFSMWCAVSLNIATQQ
jgi:hypothetical protein